MEVHGMVPFGKCSDDQSMVPNGKRGEQAMFGHAGNVVQSCTGQFVEDTMPVGSIPVD